MSDTTPATEMGPELTRPQTGDRMFHKGALTVTGKELRRLREAAGLSQAELGKMADIHARTIIRWELAKQPIPKLAALGLRDLLVRAGKSEK